MARGRPHSTLFNNGGAGTLSWGSAGPCFFDADGAGSTAEFLRFWAGHREQYGPGRLVLLASADHDFSRLCCGSRTSEQLGVAFAFLLTWGSVPSIYYGDEIGMRYQPGLPEVEGSICHPTHNRAGARTPMQWGDGANAGFSTAAAGELYLPVDAEPDRPRVAAQLDDPASTLHRLRRLIALRRGTPGLGPDASTRILDEGYPFVYLRDDRYLVVLNPRREAATADLAGSSPLTAGPAAELEVDGVSLGAGGAVRVAGFGYGVFELTLGGEGS